jgi:hypothetical protein
MRLAEKLDWKGLKEKRRKERMDMHQEICILVLCIQKVQVKEI